MPLSPEQFGALLTTGSVTVPSKGRNLGVVQRVESQAEVVIEPYKGGWLIRLRRANQSVEA